jgi:hypothetical protein
MIRDLPFHGALRCRELSREAARLADELEPINDDAEELAATSDDAEDLVIAWGRAVLEPTRGHIREMQGGQPIAHDLQGAVVGMALCGALLIDDLAPEVATSDFDKCSVCLQRLDEIRHGDTSPQ